MSSKQFSVLLVEDHILFRSMLAQLLIVCYPNARIREAANGNEAINFIQKESFEFVIMDINMPEMDGWRLFQQFGQWIYRSNLKFLF